MQFLKDANNKKELNEYLAEALSSFTYPEGRELFVTSQERVLSNCAKTMPESNHEVDSRLLLHVKHALTHNMSYVHILSNDTDVIIIAMGAYHILCADHIFDDMIVEFGMGKNQRMISIKKLADTLGQNRCQALVFFPCNDRL